MSSDDEIEFEKVREDSSLMDSTTNVENANKLAMYSCMMDLNYKKFSDILVVEILHIILTNRLTCTFDETTIGIMEEQ